MLPTNDLPEPSDAERDAADFIESARRLARLVRTLTPIAVTLHELQEALDELSAAADRPSRPAAENGSAWATLANAPLSPRFTNSHPIDLSFSSAPPSLGEERLVAPGSTGTITIAVIRTNGSLDLVRVHDALMNVEGVTKLGVSSYTRGRAKILMTVEHPVERDALSRALADAFPNEFTGDWLGDFEYQAVLGPLDLAPRVEEA